MTGQPRRTPGFSLIESTLAIAILGIVLIVAASIVSERVRAAKIRVAAGQFVMDLRAARLTALSNRGPVDVVVAADPGNSYRYTGAHGMIRLVPMPDGVRIISSTSPIRFRSNGSVLGGASTVIETNLSNSSLERWTVTTSVLGIPQTAHEKVVP